MLIRLIEGSLFKQEKTRFQVPSSTVQAWIELNKRIRGGRLCCIYSLARKASLSKMLLTTLLIMSVHLKMSASILRADINTFSYSQTHCPVYQIYSQWTGETLVQLTQPCARGDRRGGVGHSIRTAYSSGEWRKFRAAPDDLGVGGSGWIVHSHFVGKSHKANLR